MLGLSIALLAVLGATSVSAQGTSDVVCLDSFGWANNSLEQNPCVVGAYLQAECNDGTFSVNSIADGYHYIGPTNDTTTQNPCICSTPVYQLISACGACQNRTWISWTSWSFYCPSDLLSPEGTYNEPISSGTRVPAWAYIKPSDENDFFNITLAENVGDSPESTQVLSSTVSSSGTSTAILATTTSSGAGGVVTVTVTSSTTSSPTHTSGGGGGSNTGAIAGGVVGGVIGLGAIALVGFFFLRKNRNKQNANAAGGNATPPEMGSYAAGGAAGAAGTVVGGASTSGGYSSVPPGSPGPEYPQTYYTGQSAVGAGGYQAAGAPGAYYNPSDPSTFPHTPPQSAYAPTGGDPYGQQAFPAPQSGAPGYYGEPHNGGGRYSGMPEV